jgi:hypothetical protein
MSSTKYKEFFKSKQIIFFNEEGKLDQISLFFHLLRFNLLKKPSNIFWKILSRTGTTFNHRHLIIHKLTIDIHAFNLNCWLFCLFTSRTTVQTGKWQFIVGFISLDVYATNVSRFNDICNSRLSNVKNVNKSSSWYVPLTSWRRAAFRSKLLAAAKTAIILFLSVHF